MASSVCQKTPRLLLSRTLFSTLSTSSPPPQTQFPSFRAAKSAIQSESNPDHLLHLFSLQSSSFPRFLRHRPLFHLSARKLLRSHRPDLLHHLIHHQINLPTPKSEGFWIRLIMLYSRASLPDHALSTFHQIPHPTEKSLCAVLTSFIHNNAFDRVREVFDTLPAKINVSPGVKSYNLVLKAFCKANDLESARAWIQKMEREGLVAPDIGSYNLMLGGYLKDGDKGGFDGIVKEISERKLECNVTTYKYRIMRFCKEKECVRANKLLEEMVLRGVKPNSAIYNAIIDGFCKVGDLESARRVLEGMVSDGHVSPCSIAYYTMVRHMVEEGEFESALDMCKEILRRKWVPPFEAMEGLVKGLVKISKAEEARQVVEKMKKRLRGPAVDSWARIEAALPL